MRDASGACPPYFFFDVNRDLSLFQYTEMAAPPTATAPMIACRTMLPMPGSRYAWAGRINAALKAMVGNRIFIVNLMSAGFHMNQVAYGWLHHDDIKVGSEIEITF